ncbi:adenosine deaminase/editase [Thelephora terrestris]|uniref:Adenosine deaminase/editase n=1 Tax=Thelephora terrestris TaxID=56493 RepID=A0A9P6HCT7_9AGAM|nr:adenosine deaminase/editase [Thelephora terrestris]
MSTETVNPDYLATAVNAVYTSLRFKPPIGQYTILAGFVLASPERLHVISLATGSKCLPANRLSRCGESVNDSHAEILAKRGALLWFFDEIHRIKTRSSEEPSHWLEKHPSGRYRLRDVVCMHMYISTVPCGDASMRFLANSQDPEMARLKESTPFEAQPSSMPWRGRNNYHCYGVLRTKPARADSPTTASMSCSDKIAAWNVLGLQGALGSLVFMPLYVHSVVIGEVPLDIRDLVLGDCRRAFWERTQDLEGLPDGYRMNKPSIYFTSVPFVHARSSLRPKEKASSCNDSLCWIAESPTRPGYQVLINGLKRGVPQKLRYEPKSRPWLSKLTFFVALRTIDVESLQPGVEIESYHTTKLSASEYQATKDRLLAIAPFTAWIRNGEKYQNFDIRGNEVLPSNGPQRDQLTE